MRLSRTRSSLAFAGLTTGAMVIATLVAPSAALAVTSLTSITPTAGPIGTVITANATGLFSADAIGGVFSTTATCPTTYNVTAPNIAAGTPTKVSADKATFVAPTTLTLGTSNAIKAYYLCVYSGTVAGTSPLLNDGAGGNIFTLTPGASLNPATGASGGGNTVTFTLPTNAAIVPTAPGLAFNANGCATTYAGSGNIPTAAAPTRTSTTVVSGTVPATVLGTGLTTPYYVCLYANRTSGSAALLASSTAYGVTLPATTLSQPIGPISTVGNPVNLTLTSASNIYATATAPAAIFYLQSTTPTCPAIYPASPPVAGFLATIRKLANNKAALTVPTSPAVAVSGDPTPYNICQYSSTSITTGKLLSVATYSVAPVPTITSVSPSRGSALGGQTITVSGANFPLTGGLTATLGGTALTNITVLDANTFTATTPAHATGAVTLAVSSAIGSDTLSSGFTYANSIAISPNTAPNTVTAQDVDVQGTGFLDYNFTGGGKSRVYLVKGTYNDRTSGGGTNKADGAVANCASVLVISDNELVCSLNLTAQLDATGAAVVPSSRRTGTGTSTSGSNVLTLVTGNPFTQNDVGLPITGAVGADFPGTPTIVAVTSPTTAVVSGNATTGVTAGVLTIGASNSIAATGVSGESTVTGAAGVFSQSDVGRAVTTGGGIATNVVITAVDPTGATATLSVPNSGTVAGPITVTSGNPVPNGAYNLTVVSNGTDANASSTDTAYKQSEISSGSTFTVAPF